MTAQKDTGSILTANSSQWTFGGTGILEGLFEKSFCSTKQVTQFLHS